MSKTQLREQSNELEEKKRETRNDLIRDQVMHALGKPVDLLKVQVRLVWDDHYRVNILVGVDAGSVRVANSYFLVVDSDGSLIAATPKITKKQY